MLTGGPSPPTAVSRWISRGVLLQCVFARALGGVPFLGVGRDGLGDTVDPQLVRSVLVVRPDEIGDMVLLSPFLRELRARFARARIVLVVNPATRNLVELCPYVDRLVVYDQHVARRWRPLVLPWRALCTARRQLAGESFDLAILPRWDTDGHYAAFLAYFSGASRRMAYSEAVTPRKRRLNRGFDGFFTHVLDRREPMHEVERSLALIAELGGAPDDAGLELWLSDDDHRFAAELCGAYDKQGSAPLVAVHLGAGAPQRQWPVENFVALARWIAEAYSARFLIVGGPGDKPLGQEFAKAVPGRVIDSTGRATLRQTAALLSRSKLYVGNDTGPTHMAAAAGVPTVSVSSFPEGGAGWHWNSPVRFHPWGAPHRVLQPSRPIAPCHEGCTATAAHCILGVSVEQARNAVGALLGLPAVCAT